MLQPAKLVKADLVYKAASATLALEGPIWMVKIAKVKNFLLIKLIIFLACPSNCATCTSDSMCQTCKSGFGLQSNQCDTCPSGTFLEGQACKTCPTTCDTCTSDTVCQTCKSGNGLQGTMCGTCSSGTYLDGQACKSK